MWFKIELEKDGAIKTCVEVGVSLCEGRHVLYIEADSKEKACAQVAALWRARLARDYARKRAWRDAQTAKGQCTKCVTPAKPGARMCQRHLDIMKQRDREIRTGQRQAKKLYRINKLSDEQLISVREGHMEAERVRKRKITMLARNGRETTLRECLHRFDQSRETFRNWLVAEIAKHEEPSEVQAAE